MDFIKLEKVTHELIWGKEDWLISAHPNGDNPISALDKTLAKFYEENRGFFGECPSPKFPLLVKIIDAKKDLSVQVHPDDEYAKRVEDCFGKTECWYILEASSESDIVIGQRARGREELAKAISEKKLLDYLDLKTIKKGDFFYIPAGTVHAIRKNTKILEVQQASDITYRLYDYDRLGTDGKPRELHVEKSLDVIDYASHGCEVEAKEEQLDDNRITTYVDNHFFKVQRVEVEGSICIKGDRYFTLGVALDNLTINGIEVKKEEAFIIKSGVDLRVEGKGELFISTYGE